MFTTLITEIKAVQLNEVRQETDAYFEAVVGAGELGALQKKLEARLGEPVWPSSRGLEKEVENAVGEFGGIRKGQILYFKRDENLSTFAMLWPWQSGVQVTLKLIRSASTPPPKQAPGFWGKIFNKG